VGRLYPERVEAFAAIAVSGRHSAWCIGLSEAQRHAIAADPRWRGGDYASDEPPAAGLAAARMIAMCTYRSRPAFEARFGRARTAAGASPWRAGSASTATSWCGASTRTPTSRSPTRWTATTWVEAGVLPGGPRAGAAAGAGGGDRQRRAVPAGEQAELAAALPAARLGFIRSPHGTTPS